MKDNRIVVEVKHKKLRTVAFFLALIVAVCAFTGGIYAFVHKDPGWYDIRPGNDEEAPQYDNDVALTFYFAGKSDEIRVANNEVTAIYKEALSRIYKLTDPVNTYLGYTNLATVNSTPGEWIELPEELYSAVKHAFALTQEGRGYSVLSGGLYEEWQNLRYLDDPAPSDPVNDLRESGTLHSLARMIADPAEVGLDLRDETREVRLTKSDAYRRLEEKAELSGAVLDLGLLRQAFMVAYCADALSDAGYDTGLFTASGGLTYAMSGSGAGHIDLFTFFDGAVQYAGAAAFPAGGAAVSVCRAFGLKEEPGYYTVETDGGTVFRGPCYSALTGDAPCTLLSAASVLPGAKGDAIADAAYESLLLFLDSKTPENAASSFSFVTADAPETLVQ